MGRGVWTVWLVGVLLGVGAAARADDAALRVGPEVDVQWQAPAGCADREQLRAALSRELGREVHIGEDAPLQLRGELRSEPDGYVLDLQTRSRAGTEQRRLVARSCGELLRATLLIAGLLLSGDPEIAAPHEPSPPPSDDPPRGRTWKLLLRMAAALDLGSLVEPSVGAVAGVGIDFSGTRFELGTLWLPSQDLPAETGQAFANLQLMAASAGLCQQLLRGLVMSACVSADVGRLSARGEGLREARSARAPWLGVQLGLRLGLPLQEWLRLGVSAAAGVPLIRPSFAIEGVGPIREVSVVTGRFELSLEWLL
ncbi:MAG: hypothetical protein ABW321_18405 [Polyangiales bacterium]